ncbi:MAG TPA: ABC transporter permease, partial [Acidimicrobiia bacterium]|nr:ABC transporter permease [Acidimicrobiia bacterium]
MLIAVLKRFLRPYLVVLVGVVVLQAVQAVASLYLPVLNASVIDKGILRGDTGYIVRVGAVMLVLTVVQLAFSLGAVYLGSRASMGFGRDVRRALFRRVTGFSTREVNHLGAPSLITRVTNDVQQVQQLVMMTASFALAAPVTVIGGVILAVHQDGGLAWLLAVSMPVLIIALTAVVSRMVPTFRVMQERIDGINRVLREQITGIRVVRAFVREREETARFKGANEELTATSLTAGRLMAFMFPIVMLIINGSSVA